MSTPLRRFFKIFGIVVLITAGLCIIAANIFRSKLEENLHEKLLQAGVQVKSVSISFLKRSAELDSVTYAPIDSTIKNPHQFFMQSIRVSGVHIYSLLKKREIIIGHLVVRDGKLRYNKNYRPQPDTTGSDTDAKITGIRIKHLALINIHAAVLNDTTQETSAILSDLEAGEFRISFHDDTTFSIDWIEARVSSLTQSQKNALHTFAIANIDYTSKDGRLEADTFRVIPRYNKEDFARIAKIQKTRLDITVPKIILEGFRQDRFISDSVLEVRRIRIPKPVVHAYRDKRYPFVRDWIMPLPIEGIRRLPFSLKVDSILIDDADIAYEEFSEKGLPATGTITFNKLDASFAGLNTEAEKPAKNKFCTLVADCKVMNSGSLHATFKLPLNSTVNYEAYGNVRAMDLKSLNPALGNLTRVEIADGTLNDLHFNFSYNDDISKGEVLINYKDLKLEALKKEKRNHETNKILTAAINAIIKSDKDKSVDKSKRTGVIDIEREKKRFVFQFWWKSLLDGLQSTFTDNGKKKKTQKGSSR